jgi:four helix bundle protein
MKTDAETISVQSHSPRVFGHERLDVYQLSIQFVARTEDILACCEARTCARDHILRAAESVPINVVDANSRRSTDDRNRFLDVAHGSCLECAACLDILALCEVLNSQAVTNDKETLCRIVAMLVGLRRSEIISVHEPRAEYSTGDGRDERPYFLHERLEAYQRALQFMAWFRGFSSSPGLNARQLDRLDREATAIVLNIAEGNGRYSLLDHRRFLDIAQSAAFKAAACLDVSAIRGSSKPAVLEGKDLLFDITSMLMGMKRTIGRKAESEHRQR